MAVEYTLGELSVLLGGQLRGDSSLIVRGVAVDHRKVSSGEIFCCIRGVKHDGHNFIDQALASNATAILTEIELNISSSILVADTRAALSALTDLFSGSPSKEMQVIAITGTNGKTTTNWLIHGALERIKRSAIRIGTLGAYSKDVVDDPDTLTTPDSGAIHNYLAKSLSKGVKFAVLEASSHALEQCRIDHVRPNVGVFTNLTRDHLDYHKDMESYFRAKSRLFDLVKDSGKSSNAAVINIDDEYGVRLAQTMDRSIELYSFGSSPDARARLIEFRQSSAGGSTLDFILDKSSYKIESPLIGLYNGYNLLAAFCSLVGLGVSIEEAISGLSNLAGAPGRLEFVNGPNCAVFVDYAHTPDALQRALEALRPITIGNLWVVFGCGGDRDRGKRPLMGEVAGRLADRVVVTSDNPRSEQPERIIEDILSSGVLPAYVEIDRRVAIELAVSKAEKDDIVLIAGKGHEDYQIIGGEKLSFSDREVVMNVTGGRS